MPHKVRLAPPLVVLSAQFLLCSVENARIVGNPIAFDPYLVVVVVVWCGVVWYGVAWYGMAWRGMAWRGVVRYINSSSYTKDVYCFLMHLHWIAWHHKLTGYGFHAD